MSRLAQDSFISDDEEEVCPLCVEEFDISDKGFKPCPCGYQVCQFCYNNIRQNPQLNGRCPGCRRPYDDESVEYKIVTTEEWRQDHQKQTRREKEKKQKERERKEIEQASRKHLSGMRVIQKNLVYVVGLNPHIPHEELLNTLRGDQFFGQYGKIQKIVVNRRNGASGNGGIGVYVTYVKKEDAAKCIAAVDGSMNDAKILRAAYGTTKYCSSYLRNQPCPNPNCMFLHEPGEEADSYTRQDLSTIQHAARQGDMKPGLPRALSTTKSTVLPKATEESHDAPEQSALPSTASWANKASPPVQNSRPSRPATAVGSPLRPAAVANQNVVTQPPLELQSQFQTKSVQSQSESVPQEQRQPTAHGGPQSKTDKDVIPNPTLSLFENAIKMLSNSSSIKFSFSAQVLAKEDMASVQSMPPLFTFVSDRSQNGKVADKQSEGKQDGMRTESHARNGSRYNFSEKVNNSEHLLEQQQMMQGGAGLGMRSESTPPPGLIGNGQVRDSQDLISQLMSGGRLKVSLPNVDASVADGPLRAPHAQRPAQIQGSSLIPSQQELTFRKFSDESFPSLSEIYSNAKQINPQSSRRQGRDIPLSVSRNSTAGTCLDDMPSSTKPVEDPSLGSTLGSYAFAVSGESAPRSPQAMQGRDRSLERGTYSTSSNMIPIHPVGVHVSPTTSIRTQQPLSCSGPSEFLPADIKTTIATTAGSITRSPECCNESTTLNNESVAKANVNAAGTVEGADKPVISPKSTEEALQQEAALEWVPAPFTPLKESSPEVPSQSPSPAPSTASQDAIKTKRREKRAKKVKKNTAFSTVAASEEGDRIDDSRSQADTSETDSAIVASLPLQTKAVIDPLELVKVVVEELDGSNNLTFFRHPMSASVSSPHFTFPQIEFEQAEKHLPDEITSEMLGGKELEELEKEWQASKRDCESLEKKLLKFIKRNRKLIIDV
ncbi:hypothetical protein V1525DRAFT_396475 [Lipomyces kononenkoae]|uniref:Uncharacterized protein n=1 Tax=Lipomyces kononenkoae TaxID=34357 RepID=A0ACC3T958_LIPKO